MNFQSAVNKRLMLIAVVALLISTAGADGQTEQPIPKSFFGMHITGSLDEPIVAPVEIGSLGKPLATDWEYLESSRNSYEWGGLDGSTRYAAEKGIPIMFSHQWVPGWVTSDPSGCVTPYTTPVCLGAPKDEYVKAACEGPLTGTTTTDCMWKEYITSVVRRYNSSATAQHPQAGCTASNPKCHGVIQIYEGWNEPLGGPPGTSGNSMSMADFIQFETDFLNTVRANDPHAQVCSPGFIYNNENPLSLPVFGQFLQAWAAANGSSLTFDCYDAHINEPTPEQQVADIYAFKQLLAEYGLQNKIIYATEAGRWGFCGRPNPPSPVQQAYIARIEPLYWSHGITLHDWYAYESCGTLFDTSTGKLTPAGVSYGTVESWMIGSTMTRHCAHDANNTWTCGFVDSSGNQNLEIWNAAGTVSYTPASQFKHYVNVNGTETEVNGSINISSSPILLKGGPVNPDLTASISEPVAGATYDAPATLTIAASATSNYPITQVEFFANETPLGNGVTEQGKSGYFYTWKDVGANTYTLRAVAIDSQGNWTESPGIQIVIRHQ